MFGWSRARRRRPQVVAFDIVGTVFPLEPLRPSVMALGLPSAGLEGWFAAGLRDAFALSAAGGFKPFATVLAGALDQVLAEQGLSPSQAARSRVLQQMTQLPARPDAQEAFEIVTRAGLRVMALSNGAADATRALLTQAGLDRHVTWTVSVDAVRAFKPAPAVYDRAARTASVKPRRLALVAMHPWDINGAGAAGLTTAYVSVAAPYPTTMRAPDLTAASLADAARALVAL